VVRAGDSHIDNSHKRTKHLPIKYNSTEDKVVVFCGCKLSKSPPYCDGSHKSISQDKAKEIVDSNVG
jgi:CDGSH-type Zn-finger protein